MTAVRRLYVLLCGFEIIPRTVSVRGSDPRIIHAVPITAYLMDTDHGWVLFDAGLDEANLRDPARLKSHFLDPGWDPPPVVLPDHELGAQLARIGLGWSDIGTVVVSHLHADHSGHLKRLAHARKVLHRREHAHAHGSTASAAWFRDDYDMIDDWELIDGDTPLMPGIEILDTEGHSPGHISLAIDLPNTGPVILAADVGDLMENFREEKLPGEASSDTAALASIRRINALVAERGARLMLTHDPDLLLGLKLAPDFYD
ncbi:N-acyl homoserine lactonase family protein [Histidinibacterium lentulum]|uniref:N-acyl homoserine lactonase family protein n=1 Tax=Histidinibacterium lentulum TaxID=2480588 RepID=A0A3N2QR62_9RHOB|nr:N-acyl homoserine lactonase family protein [Histidinibacterium lentulum]ROT97702.1 N-acyl homoserine lactonase family protein [Histidinibacterium lentulum]